MNFYLKLYYRLRSTNNDGWKGNDELDVAGVGIDDEDGDDDFVVFVVGCCFGKCTYKSVVIVAFVAVGEEEDNDTASITDEAVLLLLSLLW